MGPRPHPQAPLLLHAVTRCDGPGRAPGQQISRFGASGPRDEAAAEEDFKAIEHSAPLMAAQALHLLLDHLRWDRAELDFVLPPQLSGAMTARAVRELDVPTAKVISRVMDVGNTSNAHSFFQLEELLPALTPGARAVAVTAEASKWIKAGYALRMPKGEHGVEHG